MGWKVILTLDAKSGEADVSAETGAPARASETWETLDAEALMGRNVRFMLPDDDDDEMGLSPSEAAPISGVIEIQELLGRAADTESVPPKRTGRPVKSVVFTCPEDYSAAVMAATLFNRVAHPNLVRGFVVGHPAPIHPNVLEALQEMGSDAPWVEAFDASTGEQPQVVVVIGGGEFEAAGSDQRHDRWPLFDLHNLELEEIRTARELLRESVWRLVAREGWYRMQPASAAFRSSAEQNDSIPN